MGGPCLGIVLVRSISSTILRALVFGYSPLLSIPINEHAVSLAAIH